MSPPEAPPPDAPFTSREQISILLEEYKALRAEVIQQNASAFALLGSIGTGAIAISVAAALYWATAGLAAFLLSFVLLFTLYRNYAYSTLELGSQLLEIEERVNTLAGVRLLCWELDHGMIWTASQKRRMNFIFAPILKGWTWRRKRAGIDAP